MGQMPASGGSGGGSAIYQDGDPVYIFVGPDESVTVPSGETWIVQYQPNGGQMTVDGERGPADGLKMVLSEGTTLGNRNSQSKDDYYLTGWSV
jgi:hypothetical protein